MTKTRKKAQETPSLPDADLNEVLHQLVDYCKVPARLVELYYWSLEPELAEVMRQFISLRPDARATLHAFFVMTERETNTITIATSPNGDVILSSPRVSNLIKRMGAHGTRRERMPSTLVGDR